MNGGRRLAGRGAQIGLIQRAVRALNSLKKVWFYFIDFLFSAENVFCAFIIFQYFEDSSSVLKLQNWHKPYCVRCLLLEPSGALLFVHECMRMCTCVCARLCAVALLRAMLWIWNRAASICTAAIPPEPPQSAYCLVQLAGHLCVCLCRRD